MPSSSIEAANKEVKSIILGRGNFKSKNDVEGNDAASTTAMKRGPYVKFLQQAKVFVAKYASEHGVTAALRHLVKRLCR